MRAILYSIAIWIRKILGLGPRHKFVNIYYRMPGDLWLLRPIVDVPHKAYLELCEEEILLDHNVSNDVIIRNIQSMIEQCHYANDHDHNASLKGWKKFVEEHLLIVGTVRHASLCFEPWGRKNIGHKNASYMPSPHQDIFCAPITDVDQAYQALCKARDATRKYEEDNTA